MHSYPIEEILSANKILDEFDSEAIANSLNQLNTKNLIITLCSKSFEG